MVGIIGIGILVGFFAGGFALISGFSILSSLLIYGFVGIGVTLFLLTAAYFYCALHRRKFEPFGYPR